jgi:hypothetical protein
VYPIDPTPSTSVQQGSILQAVLGRDVLHHKSGAVFILATHCDSLNPSMEPKFWFFVILVNSLSRSRMSKYMPGVLVSTFFGGNPVGKDAETL